MELFDGRRFDGVRFDADILRREYFREARNYRINTSSNRVAKARFSLPEVVGLLDNLNLVIE